MNEKYKELLKPFENRKTYSLLEKDQARMAMNILVCKKAMEDYVFCDPSEFDDYIESHNEDATKATVLWLIYYATEKLHYKYVKYFSVFTKDLPTTIYFGLAWIRAHEGLLFESYTNIMKNIINPVKPEYVYWYDRANVFSINRFGNTMISMVCAPLTDITYQFTSANKIVEAPRSIPKEKLLALFSLRDAKTDKNRQMAIELEKVLVKYLFMRCPREVITHINHNGGICRDSIRFPKSILVEALYHLEAIRKFKLHDKISDYVDENEDRDYIATLDGDIEHYISSNPDMYGEDTAEFEEAYNKYANSLSFKKETKHK